MWCIEHFCGDISRQNIAYHLIKVKVLRKYQRANEQATIGGTLHNLQWFYLLYIYHLVFVWLWQSCSTYTSQKVKCMWRFQNSRKKAQTAIRTGSGQISSPEPLSDLFVRTPSHPLKTILPRKESSVATSQCPPAYALPIWGIHWQTA